MISLLLLYLGTAVFLVSTSALGVLLGFWSCALVRRWGCGAEVRRCVSALVRRCGA